MMPRDSVDLAHTHAADAGALRIVRLVAAVCAVLMLVVVAASAYLRLAHVPALCGASALCEGGAQAALAATVARGAHRMAAGAVPLLLIALLVLARGQRPPLAGQAWMAAAGIVIAVGLALLGVRMGASPAAAAAPWVTLANLGGGFALLALAAAMGSQAAAALRMPLRQTFPPRGAPSRAALCAALLVGALAVVPGGLASAGIGAMRTPHLVAGALAVAVALLVAWRSRTSRAPRAVGAGPWDAASAWTPAVVALALGGAVLGAVEAFGTPALPAILAHNLCAAVLLALVAGRLAFASR